MHIDRREVQAGSCHRRVGLAANEFDGVLQRWLPATVDLEEYWIELCHRAADRSACEYAVERAAHCGQSLIVAPKESACRIGQRAGIHRLQDLVGPCGPFVERASEAVAEERRRSGVVEVDVEHADHSVFGDGDVRVTGVTGTICNAGRRPACAWIGRTSHMDLAKARRVSTDIGNEYVAVTWVDGNPCIAAARPGHLAFRWVAKVVGEEGLDCCRPVDRNSSCAEGRPGHSTII